MHDPAPIFPDPQTSPETDPAGPPPMHPLRSTYLQAAGYDPEERELLITFAAGNTIAYQGLGPEALQQLLASPSPGRWLHANLHGLPYREI